MTMLARWWVALRLEYMGAFVIFAAALLPVIASSNGLYLENCHHIKVVCHPEHIVVAFA